VAHAARGSEGSEGCRENADNHLDDGFPSFLLHGAFHGVRWLITSYDYPSGEAGRMKVAVSF
jgi:hypothetical protein